MTTSTCTPPFPLRTFINSDSLNVVIEAFLSNRLSIYRTTCSSGHVGELPGVSIKQIFLSKTISPMLFLLRNTRLSSSSDHHVGYAFVLACISVMCDVLPLSNFLPLDLVRGGVVASEEDTLGAMGSMCTISWHCWKMALIKLVFPTPIMKIGLG